MTCCSRIDSSTKWFAVANRTAAALTTNNKLRTEIRGRNQSARLVVADAGGVDLVSAFDSGMKIGSAMFVFKVRFRAALK